MTDRRVTIGRVVKAHGIRGEVAVDVLSDLPGRFDAGAVVFLAGTEVTITSSRPHQGRLLVRFEGVTDRTGAELLRGRDITAPPADVGDHDTFYVHELVGMPVVAEDGTDLGTVTSLVELPSAASYDLLEVARTDGSTWLLPAVEDYVDLEVIPTGGERLRLVGAPDGLLDDELLDEELLDHGLLDPADPADPTGPTFEVDDRET